MAFQSEEEEPPNIGNRRLIGDHCVYDLNNPRVEQFTLEPTTPLLGFPASAVPASVVPGRRIAVNSKFISLALDSRTIRVVSKNPPSNGCSLEGMVDESVTDMAFFSQDDHLLASISSGGLLYIWQITEGKDKDLSQYITGSKYMAVRINDKSQSDIVHSRVCWHCRKQDSLVVGIGRTILRLDMQKIRKSYSTSSDSNSWEVTRQTPGVHYVGQHNGEVTDLSMCCPKLSIWVSAANDGTIKVWREDMTKAIAELKLDMAVISAKFITSPLCPQHIILVTGASSRDSQEVQLKIWTSTAEDGRLDTDARLSLQCTQTLVLKSSPMADDVLFDEVQDFPQAGLLLLANANNKTVYTIHLEYGHNAAAARMDYMTEFVVTVPKLSITGYSDLFSGSKRIVQLYCLLTRAINRYELDLSRCSPPPTESSSLALPADNIKDNVQLQLLQKTLSQLITMHKEMEMNTSAKQNMQKETGEDIVQQLQNLEKTQSRLIKLQEGMEEKFSVMQNDIKEQIAGQMSVHQLLERVLGMQERMEEKFSVMQDVQNENQMQIAGQMSVHQQLLERVLGDIINSAKSTMADKGTSSFPDSQNALIIPLDMKECLDKLIEKADYGNAFATALKEGPTAVSWLCSEVDKTSMIKNKEIPLSKHVLVCLLKHLASQTMDNVCPQFRSMHHIVEAAEQIEKTDEDRNSFFLTEVNVMLMRTEIILRLMRTEIALAWLATRDVDEDKNSPDEDVLS